MPPRAAGVADREGLDGQALGRCRHSYGDIVEAPRNLRGRTGDHMHAAGIGGDREQAIEMPRGRLQQGFAAAGIKLPRAAQMGGEMALGDEAGQRALAQQRRPHRDAIHDPLGGLDQRGRQDKEAQPQRREEQLGEAAEIGDAAGAIERAQRRQRPAAVAILAVEIVLGDPALGSFGPAQQLEPALQAEHGAERKMMRRRHDRQPRFWGGGECRLGR